MPTSTSVTSEVANTPWPTLPTETEIYILPDGRIVIADLPAELARCLADLGIIQADGVASELPEVPPT